MMQIIYFSVKVDYKLTMAYYNFVPRTYNKITKQKVTKAKVYHNVKATVCL